VRWQDESGGNGYDSHDFFTTNEHLSQQRAVSREAGLFARMPAERRCMKPIRIIIVMRMNHKNFVILSCNRSQPGLIIRIFVGRRILIIGCHTKSLEYYPDLRY
jgi:hypothetical protein